MIPALDIHLAAAAHAFARQAAAANKDSIRRFITRFQPKHRDHQ